MYAHIVHMYENIVCITHVCTISTICDVELLLASVWVLAAKPPSSLRLGWSRHCSYQMYHWSITGNIYLIRAKCNNQTLHKKIKKVTKMLWNKCNFAWFPQKTLLAWVGLHCLSKILHCKSRRSQLRVKAGCRHKLSLDLFPQSVKQSLAVLFAVLQFTKGKVSNKA